jgi:uncharacterized membrane protein
MAASTPALSPSRSPVADALPAAGPMRNVGDTERWLSLLGGGLLTWYLLRRSLGTVVLLGGAGAFLYRGLQGYCPLYEKMGLSTAPHAQPASPRSIAEPEEQQRIVLASC